MTRTSPGLDLLDGLAAEGRSAVTAVEVRARLGLSPQAASNLLSRLVRDGFAERVKRGEYLLHPLGELGVSAVAGDRLGEAVAVAVGDRQLRICYRTALFEHDLLTRPGRRIQVAVDRRLYVQTLGGRPLESIIEDKHRIAIAAESFGPAMISTVERALLESAETPRRVGGISAVVEVLAAADVDAAALASTATALDFHLGLRRIISLHDQLGLGGFDRINLPERHGRPLLLDPTDPRHDGMLDEEAGVRWPGQPAELAEVVHQ